MRSIDLNADVGEGAANDDELLTHVTSASIACGAHAGNEESMRSVAARALELGVAIGAHPGHADREFYGRREIAITPRKAERLIGDQLEALESIVQQLGGRVSYLKPHGALYHQIARDPGLARVAIDLAHRRKNPLAVLGVGGSCVERAAREAGVAFYAEAFADRAYLSNSLLAPRDTPGALLEDEGEVVRQALSLATTGSAVAIDGAAITMRCDSLCLHGDGRWAVEFAAGIRLVLARRGVRVRAFTTPGS